MEEIIRSIIIGLVQGFSEFLPISSSGHLVLVPYIFGWDYNGLSFDIALHLGTTLAVIIFFWHDWKTILKNAFKINQATKNQDTTDFPPNFFWQILLATIPAAIVGYFLNDYVESNLHGPVLIAGNLIFFGIILWLVDKYAQKSHRTQDTKYQNSFLVGLAQAVALIPGVSRSGITITAARAQGFTRKDAARLSFLLSTPAVIGAFVLHVKDSQFSDVNTVFILGVLSSFISGYLAIKFLLRYLEKSNFSVFVWYRIILAVAILLIWYYR